jgi:TorA maturation chaperone TorD
LRDAGLCHAVDAAGGVAQLARNIGVAQPSLLNWNRAPAAVIAVEAATGVLRQQLRPDRFSELAVKDDAIDPLDVARAREYALLAALLACPPSGALLREITQLRGDATPLGRAHAVLAEAASAATTDRIEREYFNLFVGLGRGELLPYASYYLTGFLNERPLSRLRQDLTSLGIERTENNYEPEDHAATLCEVMAGFAAGRFAASSEVQRAFFENHLAPWIGRLFADMERAASAKFYAAVGSLGRLFLEIEAEAFRFAN